MFENLFFKTLNLLYLLLGSNTGDSLNTLNLALQQIESKIGKIITKSALYETEPWGNVKQAPFLNQAVAVETEKTAETVLTILLETENQQGRVRIEKWAPRTLDIDIIYFNNDIIVKPDLKIPHPEMHKRNFVLIPLTEISPGFIHPVFNVANKELLKRCKDTLEVKKIIN